MQQFIAKNRADAIKLAEGGNGHSQRAAYWKSGGKAYRAECLPGERQATITEDCGGLWWSAQKTVAQKLGLAGA